MARRIDQMTVAGFKNYLTDLTPDGSMRYRGDWEVAPGMSYKTIDFENGMPPEITTNSPGFEIVDHVWEDKTKALKFGPVDPVGEESGVTITIDGPGDVTVTFKLPDQGAGGYGYLDTSPDLGWNRWDGDGIFVETIEKTLLTNVTQPYLIVYGNDPAFVGDALLIQLTIPDPDHSELDPYLTGNVVTYDGVEYVLITDDGTTAPGTGNANWRRLNIDAVRGNTSIKHAIIFGGF